MAREKLSSKAVRPVISSDEGHPITRRAASRDFIVNSVPRDTDKWGFR